MNDQATDIDNIETVKGALDHDFYHAATRPQPIVSAAQAGFALAAQIKHTRSLPPGEVPETQFNVWNALVRMHEAPATTSTDALALIATAERLLFSIDINQIVEQDRQMFHASRVLVSRAASALQIACCIHKDTFTGDGETAN